MLYLTRKLNEAIIINNNVRVVVSEISKYHVKLGITFPSNTTVLREEIHDKIAKENIDAMRNCKFNRDIHK